MSFTKKALVASLLCACALPAFAYETNDFIFRAGAIEVRPDVDGGGVTQIYGNPTPGYLNTLNVNSDTQIGLTGTWMLHPQIGLEVIAATPFQTNLTLGGAKIGSTRVLPPTLLLEWYPVGTHSKWVQPYIGAGVNYTTFFHETTNGDGGILAGSNLHLSDSVGAAVKVGVDVNVGSDLLVDASVMKVWMETDVNITDSTGVQLAHQDNVKLNPYALMLGIGKKF